MGDAVTLTAQAPAILDLILSGALLSAGLALLIFCGDFLVAGSVRLAMRLRMPLFFIGLTVVAFGTSAPELFVAINAAIEGNPGLVFGNVIGSNIANILLVLGLPALLFSISTGDQQNLTVGTMLMLASTSLFVFLLFMGYGIDQIDAVILLLLLVAFLTYSAVQSGGFDEEAAELAEDDLPFGLKDSLPSITFLVGGGVVGLAIGAELTVSQAEFLSLQIPGMSPEIVGLTIVAIGTSLPELAATMAAARRRQFSVGFGNILGSNIFNIHAIVGLPALFATGGLSAAGLAGTEGGYSLEGDLIIMIAAAALASWHLIGTNPRIDRLSGLLLISCYGLYLAYLVFRTVN